MSRLPLRRNETLMTALGIGVPMAVCLLLPRLFPLRLPDFSESRQVFRFHDGGWTPAARVAGGAAAIAVSPDGVLWMAPVSMRGLSRLENGRWIGMDTAGAPKAEPPRGLSLRRDPATPPMESTSRRFWTLRRGLWQSDGARWREVRPAGVDLAGASLVGAGSENVWLWLWRASALVAIGDQGAVAARHSVGASGLPADVNVIRLTACGDRLWIASNRGLLLFSAGQWRNLGLPPGATLLADVAAAPGGDVWALGESRPLARIAAFLAPPMAAGIAGLVLTGLIIAAALRGRAENRLAADIVLAEAAGGLPGIDPVCGEAIIQRQARFIRWALPAALVAGPFVIFGIRTAARRWRVPLPGIETWLVAIVACAAVVAACRWRKGAANPSPPSPYRSAIRGPAKWILYATVFWCFYSWALLGWVNRLVPVPALAGLLKFGIVLAASTLVLSGRDILAFLLVNPAWQAGAYDTALRRLGRVALGRPTTRMIEMEGITHAFSKRPAAAEHCFRRALASGRPRSAREQAQMLGCLGEALSDQGRSDEARRCLEAAIARDDGPQCSSRVDLAEMLLKQGAEPQRALELLDAALVASKGRFAERVAPGRHADRAWALALLGRRSEAEQALSKALAPRRENYKALLASVRLAAGMAELALEHAAQAIEHWRAARDLDPAGKYGARALEQLKLYSAWGR